MTDIFNETISCKDCKVEMRHVFLNKQGSELRAIQCPRCKKQIIHPADLNSVENFKNLKDKTYNVKLRVIGNSHAISIPKEIVDFIRQQERMMDDMVRLCFKDMRTLDLIFGNQKIDADARFIKNKPVFECHRNVGALRDLDDRRADIKKHDRHKPSEEIEEEEEYN